MNDNTKHIAAKLYLYGMSKENIYHTMKDNGFKVSRKEIREYLNHDKMFGKFQDHSDYRASYDIQYKSMKMGVIKDYKQAQKIINRNYLIHVAIVLLNNEQIEYAGEVMNIVAKNPFLGYESP